MEKNFSIIFVSIFLFITLLSATVIADENNIGIRKFGDCIDLIQSCSSCTYVNFTSYTQPNGTRKVIEIEGIKDSIAFTYNICNLTTEIGTWFIDGHGDVDSVDTVFSYTYEVTLTGNETPIGMPTFQMGVLFIIFAIACFLLYLSSSMKEVAFKIFYMIISLVFVLATMLTAYMVSVEGNISTAISSTTLSLVVVLGVILFIVFMYIMIRLTINVLDMLKLKRGHSWEVGSGSSVAGYNTKKAY